MPKLVLHEDSASQFSNELLTALMDRGLSRELMYWRSATCYGSHGAKQADDPWAPKRFPSGRARKWLMIVLETALGPLDADSEAAESETQSKLDYDVRFWLGESNGDVRIVFTLKVDRKTPTVIINK